MAELYIVVEGYGEQGFLDQCVAPLLAVRSIYARAVLVGKPGHKGGVRPWPAARKDIADFLKMRRTGRPIYVSTMFDFFQLPMDWPGRAEAPSKPPPARASHVEAQLVTDMANHLGEKFVPDRFIPYIQMHELESLVLAEPRSLAAEFPGQDEAVKRLADSPGVAGVPPEDINDGSATAPSRRILAYLPEYANRKRQAAVNVLQLTGLTVLRARCSHFNDWITRLEALGG